MQPGFPFPCIGVCRLDPGTDLCAGCMCTPDEIAIWPAAGEAERLAIGQRLRACRRGAHQRCRQTAAAPA
jgi:uncharacterized protein